MEKGALDPYPRLAFDEEAQRAVGKPHLLYDPGDRADRVHLDLRAFLVAWALEQGGYDPFVPAEGLVHGGDREFGDREEGRDGLREYDGLPRVDEGQLESRAAAQGLEERSRPLRRSF